MSDFIYFIAGARPNFMKIAPLIHEAQNHSINFKLIHTGQHYDYNMSKIFFEELKIPAPDMYLNAGSGSHAVQTAKIMVKFERILEENPPQLVVVVGDVNSTIACALVAKKLFIDVVHVEAGLRSFDRRMPEEINRILTDQISDLLFTTESSAEVNLMREGIDASKIFFVGNIMIDTLVHNIKKAKLLDACGQYKLEARSYALITLHRPSNVDQKEDLEKIVKALNLISKKVAIFFPIHPRTQKNLIAFNLIDKLDTERIILTEPVGYLDFLNLMMNARFIVTDSGGIQEEASYLKVPILTMRENTERPVTVEMGTNTIVGKDLEKLKQKINEIMENSYKEGQDIQKWDGQTAQRIIKIIKDKYGL